MKKKNLYSMIENLSIMVCTLAILAIVIIGTHMELNDNKETKDNIDRPNVNIVERDSSKLDK